MWVRFNSILVFLFIILFNSAGFSQLFPVLGNDRAQDDLVFIPQRYMISVGFHL